MKQPRRRRKESSPEQNDRDALLDYRTIAAKSEKENLEHKRELIELTSRQSTISPVMGNQSLSHEGNSPILHDLQEQVTNLKKKIVSQYKDSVQRARNTNLQHGTLDEIRLLKTQKVQLLCKAKLDSVQFRISKAALEKEVLQLKKERRKNEFEMRKLLALSHRQKLVLQRKTEEASLATKRLYDLLEPRKSILQRTSGIKSDCGAGTQSMDNELKLAARVDEIRAEYDRQMEEMAEELRKYEEEAEMLREENFRLMLQDKEFECAARDSEIKELKDEVMKLSSMVSQMGTGKPQQILFQHQMEDIGSSGKNELEVSTSEMSEGSKTVLESYTSEICCSCSKKSLCKTLKCECRAAGGACGLHCGCTTSKCSNRKPQDDKLCNSVETMKIENTMTDLKSSEKENCGVAIKTSQPVKALQEVGNTPVHVTRKRAVRKTKKANG